MGLPPAPDSQPISTFAHAFSSTPDHIAFAPGRVNLIGEHIDYCGGNVLPMALNRGTTGYFSVRDDQHFRIVSQRFGERVELDLDSSRPRMNSGPAWSRYVIGTLQLLGKSNLVGMQTSMRGFDLLVDQDIGAGGLSSSASFCLLIALVALAANGQQISISDEAGRIQLAQIARQVEHEFIGVSCGIMDQMSIIMGGVIQLDCQSLGFTRVECDFSPMSLVVLDSRVERTLAGSKYNERVSELKEVASLLDYDFQQLARMSGTTMAQGLGALTPRLQRRLKHVVSEQGRVREAVEQLASRDWVALGRLFDESHASLKNDYEVSAPQVDLLVDLVRNQPGVTGARITGGGFGGCAICLAPTDEISDWMPRVSERYSEQTGLELKILVANPGAAADVYPI